MQGTRYVEVIREATPSETCVNQFTTDGEDYPTCGEPAELMFRVIDNGSQEHPLLCSACGESLKIEIVAQPGGDAILP